MKISKKKADLKPFDPNDLRRTKPSNRNGVKVKAQPRDPEDRGHKQRYLTPEKALAKARAWQYIGDSNIATPFQMSTNPQPVRFSTALPRYFREELNTVLFVMAPYWGNMLEAFGVLFEKSRDLRIWLGDRCDEVYASNNRFDHTIKIASQRGDQRRVKALKASKVVARGAIVVSALRQVLSDVTSVFGTDGLPLMLTPSTIARRNKKLDIVRGFAVQAKKLNWELQKANRQPDQKTNEKKGKDLRKKNHKPGRGNDRMIAVRQAIIALAANE